MQADATAWMAANWAYDEFYNDIGAVGARLDSAGLMRGRLVLIEVKVAVSGQIVRYAENRSMSLEAKIAGGLGALYRRESDPLSAAANARWDRRTRPVLAILAARYSAAALAELEAMLAARSAEWAFDAAVWRWTDSEVVTLLELNRPDQCEASFDALAVPHLVGRSARPAPSSLEQLLERADALGQRALLELFIAEATRSQMPLKRQRRSIIASIRSPEGKLIPALGFYLDHRALNEANVGLNADLPPFQADGLPGRQGPANGFLNLNRLIGDEGQMRSVFALAAQANGNRHTPSS